MAGEQDELPFHVTLLEAQDTAKVIQQKKRIIFDIYSSRGIGGASINRGDPHWPNVVIVRLHVSGLEDFRVSNGTLTLHASISSHDSPVAMRRWMNDDGKKVLDIEKRYSMPFKLLDSEGQRATKIPNTGGVIELWIPAALLSENPPEIKLHWIDFFRG